jgi:hypothetical protein
VGWCVFEAHRIFAMFCCVSMFLLCKECVEVFFVGIWILMFCIFECNVPIRVFLSYGVVSMVITTIVGANLGAHNIKNVLQYLHTIVLYTFTKGFPWCVIQF